MEKQLAEVVDGTEIKEITETQILCSCENDGANNMCSSENDDTCGDSSIDVKGREVDRAENAYKLRVSRYWDFLWAGMPELPMSGNHCFSYL